LNVGGLVGETTTYNGTAGGSGSSIYNSGFGLGNNGIWTNGRNGYVGNNGEIGFTQFVFDDGPVAGVGAFVNYATYSLSPDAIMEALDMSGNVIETYNVTALAPISTPSAIDDGAFRGFLRATNDTYGVRYSNAFSVLDDLTFARAEAVPEPSTIALVGVALASLPMARRRKAKNG
jgi:PEP-CTERM motif